jgi:hypothetical protein
MGYLSDHYRPELHYMRGPGPKWLEKNVGLVAVEDERSRKPTTLFRRMATRLRTWLPEQWRIRRKARHDLQWSLTDRLGGWSV